MLPHMLLKVFLLASVHHGRANIAAAFQDAHHDGFVFAARAGDFLCPFGGVHIARLTSYERLIGFDLAGEFVDGALVESEAEAVKHMPRRFLTDADASGDLVATHAIL